MFVGRAERERKTVAAMVALFCRDHHGTAHGLCAECQELLDYSRERLQRCPFMPDKPFCSKCPVHCYRTSMREKMRRVMRYAGPRMMRRHPVLALCHLIDRRFEPDTSKLKGRGPGAAAD